MSKIIDVQCHFTTPEYLEMMERHGALLEDGFPLPLYDVEEHLRVMDEANIEFSLLTLSSPSPYFRGYEQESIDMCRRINDFTADLKRKYPDRIGFNAVLPLPNVDAAIEEAVRALDELNANGITFATNARGQYLGESELEPLMQLLHKREVLCTIHPHRPEPIKEGVFSSGPVPLYEFLVDTTRAVLNMIGNGVIERFDGIKWIVPHCGSFLPNIVDRFIGLSSILCEKGLMSPVDVKANIERLYFDLSGNPAPHLLDFLLTIAKSERIMYATDYPFTNAKIGKSNLEKFLSMMDRRDDLRPYKEKILYDNAAQLLKL